MVVVVPMEPGDVQALWASLGASSLLKTRVNLVLNVLEGHVVLQDAEQARVAQVLDLTGQSLMRARTELEVPVGCGRWVQKDAYRGVERSLLFGVMGRVP